jgi:hypothetical protein
MVIKHRDKVKNKKKYYKEKEIGDNMDNINRRRMHRRRKL